MMLIVYAISVNFWFGPHETTLSVSVGRISFRKEILEKI